jgi:Fe-S cluster assembly protein SufD
MSDGTMAPHVRDATSSKRGRPDKVRALEAVAGPGSPGRSPAGAQAATELLRELTRESVLSLSEALKDPAWLRERRLQAWEAYAQMPVPDTKSEAWRYTDVSRWPWQDVEVTTSPSSPSRRGLEPAGRLRGPDSAAGAQALEDGEPGLEWLDPRAAASGVVFTDLLTAVRKHEALLEPHLLRVGVTPERGKFAALHCALLSGGTFLYVPAGVEVALPLQSLRTMRRPRGAVFPHTLIVTGPESRVTYIEESFCPTLEELALNCAATEIVAGPGSQLRIATVQEWGRHVFHYSLQRARLQRDANVSSLVVTLGGRLSRVEVQSVLEAEGGTSEMLGLYLTDGEQHVDHNTLQLHDAPHTNSDLLFKGALRDRSRSAFSGLIKVAKRAQRTDAYQKNRNLLLSPEARADSLPNLEIEANDVRCSHGATIGQADELQIFYLMSRGLTRAEAEQLLVNGFFEEVLARVPLPLLKEQIRAVIARKSGASMGGAAEPTASLRSMDGHPPVAHGGGGAGGSLKR